VPTEPIRVIVVIVGHPREVFDGLSGTILLSTHPRLSCLLRHGCAAHPCPSPLSVEEVFGRVGHSDLFADDRSTGRGCLAADGVHALDERHAVEDAGSR